MCKPKPKTLRSQKDPYRGLFEASPDALLIAGRDGTLVAANQPASILFACERADLIGSNVCRFYASLDEYERFQEAIEREEFVRDFAAVLKTCAGHRFDSLITASVWRAADSASIGGYQVIIRDSSKHARLERHIQKLRTLAAKLLIDREQERVRLGTDLHDSIGQMLVLSKVKVDALRHAEAAEREALMDALEQHLDEMAHLIRAMTFDINSPVLYSMGFAPGLAALGDILHDQYGLTVHIEVEAEWDIRDHDIRGLVYRATRELLVNVARHADTTQATVFLRRDAAHLQVVVEDAGTGFDTTHLEQTVYTRHFGLFSIQEKLLHINGRLTVWSAPGAGTRCALTLPIKYEEEGHSP